MAMTSGGNAAALKELAPSGSLRVAIAVGPAASALWCVSDAMGMATSQIPPAGMKA